MSSDMNKIKSKQRVSNIPRAVTARLVDGETVIEMAEIHLAIFWQAIAVLVIALLFGVFVAFELAVFLLLVAGLMGLYAFMRRRIFLLVVTNKRMLVRYGVLQVDVVDMHFDKIESIELERMPTAYFMGYSNVVLMGTGQRYMTIPYVSNGPAVRRAYNEVVLAD